MIRSFATKHIGPATELRIEFGRRLNLMTGDNGLGKSFVLECLWWALTRGWPGEMAVPRNRYRLEARISATFDGKSGQAQTNGRYDPDRQRWVAGQGKPPMPGLVIYAMADGGFAVWDPLRHHAGSRYVKEFADVPFQTSLRFNRDTLWNGLADRTTATVLCRGLIEDWVTWQRDSQAQFRQLVDVLGVLSRGSEPLKPGRPRRSRIGDARSFPTLNLPYGVEPITHVSAGVQRIISLAYVLVWSWYEHQQAARLTGEPTTSSIIFLFDEIEAHLHPRWQRHLLPSLLDVVHALSGQGSVQLIGATHSPLMCASVETLVNDASDRLYTFDLVPRNGRTDVELTRVRWEPRGEVDAWLKSDLFDLSSTRSIEAEEALDAAAKLASRRRASPADWESTTARLARAISPTDPFWARWERLRERGQG